jgi:hypothetical protein
MKRIVYRGKDLEVLVWSDFLGVLEVTYKGGRLTLTGGERDRMLRQLKND